MKGETLEMTLIVTTELKPLFRQNFYTNIFLIHSYDYTSTGSEHRIHKFFILSDLKHSTPL